jgi:hypothetical protein
MHRDSFTFTAVLVAQTAFRFQAKAKNILVGTLIIMISNMGCFRLQAVQTD